MEEFEGIPDFEDAAIHAIESTMKLFMLLKMKLFMILKK